MSNGKVFQITNQSGFRGLGRERSRRVKITGDLGADGSSITIATGGSRGEEIASLPYLQGAGPPYRLIFAPPALIQAQSTAYNFCSALGLRQAGPHPKSGRMRCIRYARSAATRAHLRLNAICEE